MVRCLFTTYFNTIMNPYYTTSNSIKITTNISINSTTITVTPIIIMNFIILIISIMKTQNIFFVII